jgi:hypothetical protein
MKDLHAEIHSLKTEVVLLHMTLAKIDKIASDARDGVHPADWRKDWQRNEWTKVRDLARNV